MGDEQTGPYKILSNRGGYVKGQQFAIIFQRKNDNFFVVVVPDAGDAEMSRTLCNLLNRDHRERMAAAEEEAKHGDYEDSKGYDRRGLPDQDQ